MAVLNTLQRATALQVIIIIIIPLCMRRLHVSVAAYTMTGSLLQYFINKSSIYLYVEYEFYGSLRCAYSQFTDK